MAQHSYLGRSLPSAILHLDPGNAPVERICRDQEDVSASAVPSHHVRRHENRFDFPSGLAKHNFMLKFVYCVRRHPRLSPEEFRKYWLEKHGPLVRSYAQALRARRYVQSHTLNNPALNQAAQQPRGTKAPYDGITEVWWDSIEDLAAALQTPEGQKANQTLAEDEARFCDLPNCTVFFTEEFTIF